MPDMVGAGVCVYIYIEALSMNLEIHFVIRID